MGIRILEGKRVEETSEDGACFYDSTTGTAFGPMFKNYTEASAFLKWLYATDRCTDARRLTPRTINEFYGTWLRRVDGDGSD